MYTLKKTLYFRNVQIVLVSVVLKILYDNSFYKNQINSEYLTCHLIFLAIVRQGKRYDQNI